MCKGRIRLAAVLGLAATAAWGQQDPAMALYDRVQAARESAGQLVDTSHPEPAKLEQAVTQLRGALAGLDEPAAIALAEGNIYLRGRRLDVERDLAKVYALQGKRDLALDALEAAQRDSWYPGLAGDLERNAAFAGLRDEPRFQALLQRLEQAGQLWSGKTLATPYREHLSEAERVAGLSLFWSEAKYNFVHFANAPGLDWDKAYLDALPAVIAARDTREYYDVLMRLAPLLRDGHTNVYPPHELAGRFSARPPMRTALVEDKVLVTEVWSPALAAQGVHVGDEVTAIDDLEVHRYASERVMPYVSSSTPQDAQVRAYGYQLLAGDEHVPVRLSLRSPAGRAWSLSVPRGAAPDARKPELFVFKMLPGKVAYLALDNFESDAGVKAFEQHLPQILAAKGLVLDLRRNGGGSSGYGAQILSYLSTQPIPTPDMRELAVSPVARAWGDLRLDWRRLPGSGEPYVQRRERTFDGPVAMLIGPRTYSAAEDVAMAFDRMHRGPLVGETTGGSTGQPLMFDLPGGGKARICVKWDRYPDGRELVGKGIQPTEMVPVAVEDVRSGRDAALARAVALLRGQETRP